MAYLKYYQIENEKYRELRDSKITDEEALKAYAKLFRHFGLAPIRVKFVNGKRRHAHYTPGAITLARDWMNWKTLAHEFAHYWDDVRRRAEIQKLMNMRNSGVSIEDAEWINNRIIKIRKANWHSKRHAKLLDRVIKYIEKKEWNTGMLKRPETPTAPPPPIPKTEPVHCDMRQAVFAALPDQLSCPKCGKEKHKDQFGVRVMAKDEKGNPTKVIRQSYCRPCRSS